MAFDYDASEIVFYGKHVITIPGTWVHAICRQSRPSTLRFYCSKSGVSHTDAKFEPSDEARDHEYVIEGTVDDIDLESKYREYAKRTYDVKDTLEVDRRIWMKKAGSYILEFWRKIGIVSKKKEDRKGMDVTHVGRRKKNPKKS